MPDKIVSPTLTQERLRELFSYDPPTGVFTRRVSTSSNARAGEVAGYPDRKGYLNISMDGKRHLAHRLAWFYVHGEWPEHVDHINRVKSDNRIENLRNVSNQANHQNMKNFSNNTSGYPGVYWDAYVGKWRAEIKVLYKKKYIGVFADLDEAIKARKDAEVQYWGQQRAE